MSRTMRIAALVAALSVTAAGALVAQSADSTRAPRPRRMMSDTAGAPRGQFPRSRAWSGAGPNGSFGRGPGGFGAPGQGLGPSQRGAMRRGPGGGMLRGITLSESQVRALKGIRVKHISAMKPLQVEMIAARADAQIAQLNGDQKALDAANARLTTTRDQMRKLMEERSPTTDLRSVLTPDQQKILDKNLTEGAARRASMMRGMPGMRGPGGMRGYRPGMQHRGFGPGQPGGMPGNGMRPGMGPRRGDDTEDLSDASEPAEMSDAFDDEDAPPFMPEAMGPMGPMFADLDEPDDMGTFDDDLLGWDDFALLPPPAPELRLNVPLPLPPAPRADKRP